MSETALQILFGGLMLATYAVIAFELLHKTVAALVGALAMTAAAIATGLVDSYTRVYDVLGHDLPILAVIIGTSILVELAGQSGLFHFVAIKIVKRTGGHPVRLFLALQLLVFVFAALLTIVPAMLIVSGLTLVISKSLRLSPTPYLLGIAFASNSGTLCTFASGMPTLMVGSAAKIPYGQFLVVSLPFALVSLVVCYCWTRYAFRDDLTAPKTDHERAELQATVEAFDEWALAPDLAAFSRAAIVLCLTIVGFAVAKPLGVGPDFVALVGGAAMLLFHGKHVEETVKKVNWVVILFFSGLFIIVGLVKETHALERLAGTLTSLTGDSVLANVATVTWFSGVASAIVDNIPVAATMIPMVPAMDGIPHEPLWWSLILGANLGGNATPIGSISCVIALHALAKEAGIQIGWGRFLAVGGVLMIVQLVLATLWIAAYVAFDLLPELPAGAPGEPTGH
ncbi:MAG: ArsB/NhaD family transporter [Planctomycetes bacterium]|nr:ArsB/NhaD family transporter [Planctomycetota bacterium]